MTKVTSVLNKGNTFFFDKQKNRVTAKENGPNEKYILLDIWGIFFWLLY